MENFKDMRFILKESKDRLIDKTNLTDEQKAEAKAFFNKYPSYEREIDWNKVKTLTWEDFKKVITKDRSKDSKSQVKKAIRKGLEGFTEGDDFDVIHEGTFNGFPYTVYQPYTWEASRMIASKSVPPTDTVGEWCTAYQKDSGYWKSHTYMEDNSAFAYVCGESIPTKKVALEINDHLEENCDGTEFCFRIEDSDIMFNIWDNEDYCLDEYEVDEDFLKEILASGVIRKALSNVGKIKNQSIYTDPKTGKIIYNDNLTITDSMVKDGKIDIRYDVVNGYMYIGDVDVRSLEGCPEEVNGEFSLYGLPNLASLEGAPKKVRSLRITACNALGNLVGCPQVDERIVLSRLKIFSFEGLPRLINGTFEATVLENITSLEHAPVEAWSVKLSTIKGITSLNGIPRATSYHLTSLPRVETLEGLPEEVTEVNIAHVRGLKNLKGLPQNITSTLYIDDCEGLTTLEGCPESIKYDMTVTNCDNLVSAEGLPRFVGRGLAISMCPNIVSVPSLPEGISELNLSHDVKLQTVCDIPQSTTVVYLAKCMSLKDMGFINHDLEGLDITGVSEEAHNSILSNGKGLHIKKVFVENEMFELTPSSGELYRRFTPSVISTFQHLFPNEEATVENIGARYIGSGAVHEIARKLIKEGAKVELDRRTVDTSVASAKLLIGECKSLTDEQYKNRWGFTKEDFLTGRFNIDDLEWKVWSIIDNTYGDYITEEVFDSPIGQALIFYTILGRLGVKMMNRHYFKG